MSTALAVIGSLNIDLIMRVPRFPTPGENVITRSLDILVGGGKGGNQAVALARLGATVHMIGLTGSTMHGPEYLEVLRREGVNCSGVSMVPGLPGLGIVAVDDHGENLIVVHPGANGELTTAHVDAHWPTDVNTVLVQNEIPLATTLHALRRARACGKRTILDPAPATAFPDEILALADLVTPNRSELALIAGMPVTSADDTIRAARRLIARGSTTVIAKAGGDGAWIVEANSVVHIPAFPVQVVDCTAAGDAFNAGLAYTLAHGGSLPEAVRFANAVGGLATTKLGAQTALPTLATVREFLATHPALEYV